MELVTVAKMYEVAPGKSIPSATLHPRCHQQTHPEMSRAVRILLSCTAIGQCISATRNILSTTVQDEGNACFDMAAAMPGLKTVSGMHIIVMLITMTE